MTEDQELDAMATISRTLSPFDSTTRRRIVLWLLNREGLESHQENRGRVLSESDESSGSLADYFDLVHPETPMERALAVACYLQTYGGKEELTGQEINDELKNLGFAIPNITRAIQQGMEKTPRLIHQTRKEGSSKQARKKYKVTREGLKYINSRASATIEDR